MILIWKLVAVSRDLVIPLEMVVLVAEEAAMRIALEKVLMVVQMEMMLQVVKDKDIQL